MTYVERAFSTMKIVKNQMKELFRGTRLFSSAPGGASPPPLDEDFKTDKFKYEFLNDYYGEHGGPYHIIMSMCLPIPYPFVKLGELREMLYIHGPWYEPTNVLTLEQQSDVYDRLIRGFEIAMKDYEEMIMYYWVDFKNPTSLKAGSFILRQWAKHGLPAGVLARMYLCIGLSLRLVNHETCGITVGHAMEYNLLFEQLNASLGNIHMFGENIGADVYPQIKAMYDPRYSNDINRKQNQPYLIEEIRPHFAKMKVEVEDDGRPSARFKVVSIMNEKHKFCDAHANEDSKIVMLFPIPPQK